MEPIGDHVKKKSTFELTPAIAFMAGAYLVPFILIVVYAVKFGGKVSIFTPLNSHVVYFTFYQAILSTILAIAVGLPGAYLIGRTNFKFKYVFSALSTIPFVMPSISMALGFYSFFGYNGILNTYFLWPIFHLRFEPLYSLMGIVMGNAFYNFPLIMIVVGGAISTLDPIYLEAARIDGASKFKGFLHVELPMIFPSVATSSLLAFVYCFTSFAVVLMIGGARYATLEVQIYMYLRTLFDFKGAAALTLLQLIFIGIFTFLFSILRRSSGIFSGEKISEARSRFPKWGYAYVIGMIIFVFGPIFSQIIAGFWNFQSSKPTLEWVNRLFSGMVNSYIGNSSTVAILWTIVFATSSALLVVLLSITGAHAVQKRHSSILEALFTSPLAVSPITLAFGYVILQNHFSLPFPVEIIAVYTVISFPIGFQTLLSGWERFPTEIDDAASVDGAGFWTKTLKIRIPILKPQIISAFLFSFAIAMGEVSATMLLYDPQYPTISISAYRLFSSRHIPEAQALSALLTVATFFIFYFLEKPFSDKKGGF